MNVYHHRMNRQKQAEIGLLPTLGLPAAVCAPLTPKHPRHGQKAKPKTGVMFARQNLT